MGRSSKHQGQKGDMEVEKRRKLKQQPHLSGAYIRNLVKQLTSSRNEDPLSSKALDIGHENGLSSQNHTKSTQDFSETQQNHQAQQPKRQVRRRLHTSRPYQERLLNMAEARREIVTALKFHRASMKQAANQQQQHKEQSQSLNLPLPPPPPPLTCLDHEESFRNPVSYPSNYLDNYLFYAPFSCPPPNPFPWSSSLELLPIANNLNLSLPNQPLGLNLNFNDFNNLDRTIYYHTSNINNPSTYLYPSPSFSSSPTLSRTEESHSTVISPEELHAMSDIPNFELTDGELDLHLALDDEDMAEIRSIGVQHEMEWNDRLNLVKSAWWLKLLKKMEIGPDDDKGEEDDVLNMLDEVMKFPVWMNPNEHLDYEYHSQD